MSILGVGVATPDFDKGVVGGRGISMKYYYILNDVQEYEMKTLAKVMTFHK